MEKIMTDEFIITFPSGVQQTKKRIVAMTRASRAFAQRKMNFHTEEIKSRVYGDTVILIGKVIIESERGGKTIKEESRYTDT